jgi:hypothetical protein
MKHILLATLLAVTTTAWAQATVQIEEAWVRGTVAQQKASGAFMRLTANQNLRLVEASSPVAAVTEIHEMAMQQDVMTMRRVPGIDLVAGQTTELKPGGFHVMLMDLKQPLQAGQTVPITLVFEGANKARVSQVVQATVRPLGQGAAPATHSHGHRH